MQEIVSILLLPGQQDCSGFQRILMSRKRTRLWCTEEETRLRLSANLLLSGNCEQEKLRSYLSTYKYVQIAGSLFIES
jgi:hypothetical protein